MNEEEKAKKTDEKTAQIKSLCELLKVQMAAEQFITKEGFIRTVIVFRDMEEYPQTEVKEVKPGDQKAPTPEVAQIPEKGLEPQKKPNA